MKDICNRCEFWDLEQEKNQPNNTVNHMCEVRMDWTHGRHSCSKFMKKLNYGQVYEIEK